MTYQEIYEKQYENYLKRVYPIFLAGLQVQIQPVISFIKLNNNTNPPLDLLVNPNDMIIPIQSAYEKVGLMAAKREYYGIRAEKSVISLLVDKWKQIFYDYSTKYAYRIKNDLAETTKDEIRKALTESYKLNLNADQTASYIRKSVQKKVSRSRAVLISRTETTTAANLGKEQGAKSWLAESGQKGYKQWLGRDDESERYTHRELNNTIIPIDNNFNVGGEEALLPGQTTLSADERCNCRCTVLYMSERRYQRMQEETKRLVLEDLV